MKFAAMFFIPLSLVLMGTSAVEHGHEHIDTVCWNNIPKGCANGQNIGAPSVATTLEECQQRCGQATYCKSIMYTETTGVCQMNDGPDAQRCSNHEEEKGLMMYTKSYCKGSACPGYTVGNLMSARANCWKWAAEGWCDVQGLMEACCGVQDVTSPTMYCATAEEACTPSLPQESCEKIPCCTWDASNKCVVDDDAVDGADPCYIAHNL